MSAIMRVSLLVVLIALFTPAFTRSQPATRASEPPPRGSFLGLQQAIELGLDNHPLVQEAGASLKAASAQNGTGAVHLLSTHRSKLRYGGRSRTAQSPLFGRRIPGPTKSESIRRGRVGQPADF